MWAKSIRKSNEICIRAFPGRATSTLLSAVLLCCCAAKVHPDVINVLKDKYTVDELKVLHLATAMRPAIFFDTSEFITEMRYFFTPESLGGASMTKREFKHLLNLQKVTDVFWRIFTGRDEMIITDVADLRDAMETCYAGLIMYHDTLGALAASNNIIAKKPIAKPSISWDAIFPEQKQGASGAGDESASQLKFGKSIPVPSDNQELFSKNPKSGLWYGIVIYEVLKGKVADVSGIMEGDLLVQCDGKPVKIDYDAPAGQKLVWPCEEISSDPEKEYEVKVLRKGEMETFVVKGKLGVRLVDYPVTPE
jgi:hypothetical protein